MRSRPHDLIGVRDVAAERNSSDAREGEGAEGPNRDATPASLKPRLVLEYQRPEAGFWDSLAWHQHQHDAQHSGRCHWIPNQTPTGFALSKIPLPKR